MRSNRSRYLIWGALFLIGAVFMVVRVGFWNHVQGTNVEDVNIYQAWSDYIAGGHALPTETTWQYPPGVAFLMLIPRLGGSFSHSWIALMLLFDFAGLLVLAGLARREGRNAGVWVWLLTMPLLWSLPILRFDLVPTVITIGALVLIHRRPHWFGALVGFGAMVKVWPILLLFGEWDRRRLLRSLGVAVAVCVTLFVISALLWGKQSGFISNQDHRGLQVEAVAATPWELKQTVTGEPPVLEERSGTEEVISGTADTVASAMTWVSVMVLLGVALWWVARDRAIRRGAAHLGDVALSRDFIFVAVLWFVVVSRVLSPQYLIWLIGLAAVVLSGRDTRIERSVWIVVGAVVITAGIYQSPANFVFRNAALVYAAVESGWIMFRAVRPGRGSAADPVRTGALSRLTDQ